MHPHNTNPYFEGPVRKAASLHRRKLKLGGRRLFRNPVRTPVPFFFVDDAEFLHLWPARPATDACKAIEGWLAEFQSRPQDRDPQSLRENGDDWEESPPPPLEWWTCRSREPFVVYVADVEFPAVHARARGAGISWVTHPGIYVREEAARRLFAGPSDAPLVHLLLYTLERADLYARCTFRGHFPDHDRATLGFLAGSMASAKALQAPGYAGREVRAIFEALVGPWLLPLYIQARFGVDARVLRAVTGPEVQGLAGGTRVLDGWDLRRILRAIQARA